MSSTIRSSLAQIGRVVPKILGGCCLLWGALAVSGCASRGGVFPVGGGIYETSASATWERGALVGARRMALEDATKHCQGIGGALQLRDSREGYEHFSGGTVTLTFTCTPAK